MAADGGVDWHAIVAAFSGPGSAGAGAGASRSTSRAHPPASPSDPSSSSAPSPWASGSNNHASSGSATATPSTSSTHPQSSHDYALAHFATLLAQQPIPQWPPAPDGAHPGGQELAQIWANLQSGSSSLHSNGTHSAPIAGASRADTSASSASTPIAGPSTLPTAATTPAVEDLEDKRVRNTLASARFRAKKKAHVETVERNIRALEAQHKELEVEVADLRKENGLLKDMVQLKYGAK